MDPFTFKHVRGGKPIAPEEIPKLPPAAAKFILKLLREKEAANVPNPKASLLAESAIEMAMGLVHMSLRRMEPGLMLKDIEEDEDDETIMRCYRHIQLANPAIFPRVPSKPGPEAGDPKAEPPAAPAQ